MKPNFAVGAAFAGLAVALGAFAAHALKSHVNENELQIFETAVRYQMYHGLGLMILALAPKDFANAARALTLGTIIFSGSLYVLVFSGIKWLGAITPIGGLLLIIGWGLVTFRALKS